MRTNIVLMILVGIVGLYVLGVHMSNVMAKRATETFENEKPANMDCPKEATRMPDGTIQVQPGNQTYKTMQEYLNYLNGIYASGSMCVPPKVTTRQIPIPGIIGGLGTNTEGPESVARQGTDRRVLDFSNTEQETYAKTPIDKLDDYEYTRVFESENQMRNALTPKSKSELMNNHKLDWPILPFNSEDRSKHENEFVAGREEDGFRDPVTGVFFKNMDGKNIVPPDMDASKQREQKVLSAYKPTDISTHVVDDEMKKVAQIVNAAYKNDQWEPVVTKVGDYQWEVSELRPKPRKEQYEEEKTRDLAMAQERGETMPPPAISIDDRMRDDPYFDKSGVGDRDNNKFWKYEDFNKWTPDLERMFAPTLSNREWS